MPPALSTVSYNANNQQTTFGSNTENYDLNGNMATDPMNLFISLWIWIRHMIVACLSPLCGGDRSDEN